MASYDKDYDSLPERYRPLSAWEYFGYNILFLIPVLGLILLIVFSLSDSNYNRRNFARSYFCALPILLFINLLLVTLMLAFVFTILDLSGFENLGGFIEYFGL